MAMCSKIKSVINQRQRRMFMKNEIRREVRQRALSLDRKYKSHADKIITRRVLESEEYKNAEAVFCYVSTNSEPDTIDIIENALSNGKIVCVPKTMQNGVMKAVKIDSLSVLEKGFMGIYEPKGEEYSGKIDLAIVPCLSASYDGRRLGHGGGYYDRFLSGKDIYKMCLCFARLIRNDIPANENDIIMDKVVTDMKIIAHRSGPDIYPEQTVASARRALSLGADMIEIDIRFDADGDMVICHDNNSERVFGKDKLIGEMTTAEFLSLRHKNNPDYKSHLFSDYIDAGIKPLLLHIKEGGENITKILDFLKEKNYLQNIIMGVSAPGDIERVKEYDREIPVLAFIKNESFIDAAIDSGADFVRLWQKYATKEHIDHINSRGKKVWIMLGNTDGYETGYTSAEFFDFLLSEDVDGILINEVNFAFDRM